MKKLLFLIIVVVSLAFVGCTKRVAPDGRTYLSTVGKKTGKIYYIYDLTVWDEIAADLRAANDECLSGKRMDCWGDPAGGGAGGGGGGAGGGGGV